nr:hypothetical protein [Ectobacillus panaciterrae]
MDFIIRAKIFTMIANVLMLMMKGFLKNDIAVFGIQSRNSIKIRRFYKGNELA